MRHGTNAGDYDQRYDKPVLNRSCTARISDQFLEYPNHVRSVLLFPEFNHADMAISVKELIMPDEHAQKINVTWVVAAALINAGGEVLVQKRASGRSMAGLWEFPGGKVEPNERPEDALVRELNEELGITVIPDDLAPLSFASAPLGGGHLLLLLYICQKWSGEPAALDAEAIRWSSIDALQRLAMPPADVPLIKALLTLEVGIPSLS